MADRQQSFQSSEQFRVPAPSRSHQFIFNKLLSISIATRALQSCQCCPSKFYMQNLSFFPTLSLNFHKNLWYWSRAKIHISSAGTGEVKNLLQNCEILPWEKMAPFSWIHCEWNLLTGPEKWHHFETMLFFFCKKNHSLPPQKKNPAFLIWGKMMKSGATMGYFMLMAWIFFWTLQSAQYNIKLCTVVSWLSHIS